MTEHHLELLSLKEGCTGSSESTHVKMPHCWKSCVTAHFRITIGHHILLSFSTNCIADDTNRCLLADGTNTSR